MQQAFFKKMPQQYKYDVIVIGAGAAGLLAAGRAGELGARVLLLEKMSQPGRKLMITGKGRCNITNDAPLQKFISHIQPNGRFLLPAFSSYFKEEIIDLLNRYGLKTIIERGGRIFPSGGKSADIVNALVRWVCDNHVEIRKETKVQGLSIEKGIIKAVEAWKDGMKSIINASSVIVCTGGKSYPATGSTGDGYRFASLAGHTIEPIRQSLVPLTTSGKIAGKLQGLTLKNVKAAVFSDGKKRKEEFGELLFTDFGLSGPIILTLSRLIVDEIRDHKNVEISIDLKPALDEQKLDARFIRDLNDNGKQSLGNIFRLWLPVKMIPVFLEILSIDPHQKGNQVSGKERKNILNLMKGFKFRITGYRPFSEAIITAGGVNTDEINPKTMESKLIKNLYFAGEVLDLDADTGGYNLQIAWSTGWLAGNSAVQNKVN